MIKRIFHYFAYSESVFILFCFCSWLLARLAEEDQPQLENCSCLSRVLFPPTSFFRRRYGCRSSVSSSTLHFFHLYNVIFTSINNVSSANHVRQRGFTEYQAEFTNYKRILGLSLRWLPELFTWLFTLDTREKTPPKETGRRAGILVKLRKRQHRPPLPSILLANVQSLDNKLDE